MAPVIRISDDTFAMLQKVALPLVDTPDSAIRRVLGAYLEGQSSPSRAQTPKHYSAPQKKNGPKFYDPDSPPDLTHASFLSGEVAGISVNKWNYLMVEAHAQAFKALNGDLNELQRFSEAHIQQGGVTESGFKPVKNFGFSVQGVDANKAWSISYRLAKKFGFPLIIEFRWQQKEGAAFPGEVGRIEWEPQI